LTVSIEACTSKNGRKPSGGMLESCITGKGEKQKLFNGHFIGFLGGIFFLRNIYMILSCHKKVGTGCERVV